MTPKQIGSNIKTLREQRGLTQSQLGEKTGMGKSYVSLIENGKLNVTLETLRHIAKALDATLTIILT